MKTVTLNYAGIKEAKRFIERYKQSGTTIDFY